MPTYTVTDPETGRKLKLTGDSPPTEQELEEIFASAKPVAQPKPETYSPTDGMSTGEKLAAGFGKSIYDTGRGIKQLFGGYTQDEIDQQRQADAPLMNTGGGIVGNIVGAGAQAFIPGAGAAKLTAGLGKVAPYAGAALSGGAFAGSQPVGANESRLGNSATGAALGVGGQALGVGANRIAKGASDKYGDDVIELYNRAKNAGVTILPHQLSDSRMFKTAASVLSQLPFTGSAAANKAQVDDYTRMISKTIGQNADAISPEVLDAAKASNSAMYSKALDGAEIPIGSDIYMKLLRARNKPASLTVDEKAMFDELIDEIATNSLQGVLSGNVYQTLREGWMKNGNNVSKAVRNIMEGHVENSIPPSNVSLFKQANRTYKISRLLKRPCRGLIRRGLQPRQSTK